MCFGVYCQDHLFCYFFFICVVVAASCCIYMSWLVAAVTIGIVINCLPVCLYFCLFVRSDITAMVDWA